jgi:hypothetical protein
MKKYLLVFCFSILLIACQKESSNPVDNGKNPYLNGNSEASDSYYPTSKGTWWKYSGIINGQSVIENITVSTEKQIDGIYYATLTGDVNGTKNESYLRVQNNEYYSINIIADYGVKREFELCFFKSDKPVGEKWVSGILYNKGTPNRYIFEIIEKDGTYVVNSKTFIDVIVIRVTDEINIPTTTEWLPMLSFDLYFSKGVGLIKADYGFLGYFDLIDYSIK